MMLQLIWPEMLDFIWVRLRHYRSQKTRVGQWDEQGKAIKRLADESRRHAAPFIDRALQLMGVRVAHPPD